MPNAEEWFQHGMQLIALGRKPEAAQAFQNAVLLKSDHAGAWANRGALLHEFGENLAAILHFNQALTTKEDPGTINNRGVTWQELGAYDSAFADYRRALQLDPAMVLPSNNIGNLLTILGKVKEARDQYTISLGINPGNAEAKLFRAMMHLDLGEFEQGWEDFEARWISGQIPPRFFENSKGRIPVWSGEDLDGKRLYLYGEQGLGDMVQFVRYAKVIKDKYPAAYVGVEVGLPLVRLLRNVEGVDEIVAYGDQIKTEYDYVCPMLTAPRVLKTCFDTIPAEQQYIYPDPYRVKVWRRELNAYPQVTNGNKLVGLCWSGLSRPLQQAANKIDARRSTDLATFAPLFQVPGVTFVSLQHGNRSEQSKNPPPNAPILDNTDQFQDFQDTAALIANLDLVIAVDTSVVHVAAAMGKPTWVLSRYAGCWRWHLHSEGFDGSSPWYPSAKVFRQHRLDDWSGMMRDVEKCLRAFVAQNDSREEYELYTGNKSLSVAAE